MLCTFVYVFKQVLLPGDTALYKCFHSLLLFVLLLLLLLLLLLADMSNAGALDSLPQTNT